MYRLISKNNTQNSDELLLSYGNNPLQQEHSPQDRRQNPLYSHNVVVRRRRPEEDKNFILEESIPRHGNSINNTDDASNGTTAAETSSRSATIINRKTATTTTGEIVDKPADQCDSRAPGAKATMKQSPVHHQHRHFEKKNNPANTTRKQEQEQEVKEKEKIQLESSPKQLFRNKDHQQKNYYNGIRSSRGDNNGNKGKIHRHHFCQKDPVSLMDSSNECRLPNGTTSTKNVTMGKTGAGSSHEENQVKNHQVLQPLKEKPFNTTAHTTTFSLVSNGTINSCGDLHVHMKTSHHDHNEHHKNKMQKGHEQRSPRHLKEKENGKIEFDPSMVLHAPQLCNEQHSQSARMKRAEQLAQQQHHHGDQHHDNKIGNLEEEESDDNNSNSTTTTESSYERPGAHYVGECLGRRGGPRSANPATSPSTYPTTSNPVNNRHYSSGRQSNFPGPAAGSSLANDNSNTNSTTGSTILLVAEIAPNVNEAIEQALQEERRRQQEREQERQRNVVTATEVVKMVNDVEESSSADNISPQQQQQHGKKITTTSRTMTMKCNKKTKIILIVACSAAFALALLLAYAVLPAPMSPPNPNISSSSGKDEQQGTPPVDMIDGNNTTTSPLGAGSGGGSDDSNTTSKVPANTTEPPTSTDAYGSANSRRWELFGNDIESPHEEDYFGSFLSLAEPGKISLATSMHRMAISAPGGTFSFDRDFPGSVTVYDINGQNGQATQIGETIFGSEPGSEARGVLSRNGAILAVAEPNYVVGGGGSSNNNNNNNNNEYYVGQVRVFELSMAEDNNNHVNMNNIRRKNYLRQQPRQEEEKEQQQEHHDRGELDTATTCSTTANTQTGDERILLVGQTSTIISGDECIGCYWKLLGDPIHPILDSFGDGAAGTRSRKNLSVALSANGNILAIASQEVLSSGSYVGKITWRQRQRRGEQEQQQQQWRQQSGGGFLSGNSAAAAHLPRSPSSPSSPQQKKKRRMVTKIRNLQQSDPPGQLVMYQFQQEQQQEQWLPLGSPIELENLWDKSGYSLTMSSDGLTVAIATDYYLGSQSVGIVKVFEYTTINDDNNNDNGGSSGGNGVGEWTQLGRDIQGYFPWQGDYFGIQASLSADGRTIAVASLGEFTTGGAGVFTYDSESKDWYQMGGDLVGDDDDDREGLGRDIIDKVFLSDDGRRVAIASTWNEKGYVYAYEYRGGSTNNWIPLGQKLMSGITGEQYGDSISLSSTGNLLAVGSSTRFSTTPMKGKARLYALRFVDDDAT